ncbi:MAG TPA: histidine kinase [Phenylobacterium sp.]|nr:histidine kinase [Phenylobacterium sp.]
MQLIMGGPTSGKATRVSVNAGAANEDTGARRRRAPVPGADAAPAEERSFSPRSPRSGAGPSEIAILDAEGRIIGVNQAWRVAVAAHKLGARDAGVGAAYADLVCKVLPDLERAALERALQRLFSGKVDDLQHTFPIPSRDGPRWRHVQIAPLSMGGVRRFVAIHDDQTALAATQEALKVTSGQLLMARDEERQRIAIELHDSTSQHLAAASLSLAHLRRVSRSRRNAVLLDEIAKSLDEVVKETRVLAYLMRPRGLGRNGLSATTLQFLEGFARRTGLEVALEADGAVDSVPAPLQHAALRIVQEALLNANRHAEARRVSVELSVDDGLLKVCVLDDGHGMRSDGDGPCLGVGIPGMQARAQQFSGELAVSSDESGTRVIALLPLP